MAANSKTGAAASGGKGKGDQAKGSAKPPEALRVRSRSLTGFGNYRRAGRALTREFTGYELTEDEYNAFEADPNIEMIPEEEKPSVKKPEESGSVKEEAKKSEETGKEAGGSGKEGK